jgi:hypothetical protein
MTDTTSRPFSTSSVISPHAALEALALDMDTSVDINSMEHIITSSAESPTNPNPDPDHDNEQGPSTSPRNGAKTGPTTPISPRYIVRAQFDFDASDPSALSFKSGDVIEVYTMLESGWWDGMLDGRRGWFPSNFVEEFNEDDEGDEQEESSLGHDHGQEDEHTHGLGLVGDERDRERDMKMLQQDEFGVPSRHRRDLSSTSVDLEGAGWGSGGLDDLAREMMDSSIQDEGDQDDGKAFEAEALRRRRLRDSDDTSGGGDFGTLRTPYSRRREETDNTIRQSSRAGPSRPGTSGKAKEGMEDAWIPSLTQDGQVRLCISERLEGANDRSTTSIHILARHHGKSQIHPRQAKDQGKKKISTIQTTLSSTIRIPPPPAIDNQEEMDSIKIQPPPHPITSTATLRKKHSDFHLILMAKSLIPGYPACRMMEKVSSTIIELRVNHAQIYRLVLLDSRMVDAHPVKGPERVWKINNG